MAIGHTIAQSIKGLREIDPLEAIATLVPWEIFRADNQAVVLTPEEAKKSKADRKAFDAIAMFRMWCCGRCKSRGESRAKASSAEALIAHLSARSSIQAATTTITPGEAST
jgi:hypothetical protein